MSFASLDTVFTLQSLNLTNAMNPRTLLLHYALVVDMAVAGYKDLAFVTPESPRSITNGKRFILSFIFGRDRRASAFKPATLSP